MKPFTVATITSWGITIGLWLIAAIFLLLDRDSIGPNIGAGLVMLFGAVSAVVSMCITIIHFIWWVITRKKK